MQLSRLQERRAIGRRYPALLNPTRSGPFGGVSSYALLTGGSRPRRCQNINRRRCISILRDSNSEISQILITCELSFPFHSIVKGAAGCYTTPSGPRWTSGFGHQGSSTFFMPSGTTYRISSPSNLLLIPWAETNPPGSTLRDRSATQQGRIRQNCARIAFKCSCDQPIGVIPGKAIL